jgi:hypothetical protein
VDEHASSPTHHHEVSEEGKMEHSFINFKVNYPNWQPNEQGSLFLNKILSNRTGAFARQRYHTADETRGGTLIPLHPFMMRPATTNVAAMGNPITPGQGSSGNNAVPNRHAYNDPLADSFTNYPNNHSDSTTMAASILDAPKVGRELVQLLNAMYHANSR